MVGLRSDFTILDTDDQIRLMRQVIEAGNIDEKRWPGKLLASLVDGWKNRGLTPGQVPAGEAFAFANGRGAEMYAAYQERLKILNAADFGDLLLECLRLFRERPDVLADYHKRFRYILVDEYQDTNVAQYLWLRLLAQGSRNLCCVGDDDQSIYGWRGAEVDNILRFEHDFPGAVVVRLERNYRSTSHILAAASHLIANNEARLGKTLRTMGEDGEKISVRGSWDSEEEARIVGEEIEQLQHGGHSLDQVAILVRASFQMREFEERFVTLGLPYRVIGGPRFYERQEVRDALAYFRVTVQPSDDLAFERIVNTPRRGLGDATIQQLHAYARSQRMPLSEAARFLIGTDEIKAKPRKAIADLLRSFDRWRLGLGTMPHTALAEQILEESGYTDMWQKERSADAPGRLENLKELVRSMETFENMPGFLEHVSLVMEVESSRHSDEAVTLMTLHGAKGLEFDTVFLPGWEEALFPSQRALDESGRAGLEEERRLAYVGLTRARKRITVTFAANRRIHGLWQNTVPSRFVNELPEAHVEVEESRSGYGGQSSGGRGGYGASRFDSAQTFQGGSYDTPGWQRAQRVYEDRDRIERETPTRNSGNGRYGPSPFGRRERPDGPKVIEGELVAKSTGPASAYRVGDRVLHLKFGPGTVAGVEGNKLLITFDKAGEKRVLDSFVERA